MNELIEFLLARIAERERPCTCLEGWNNACGGGFCRNDCRVCSDGNAFTSDARVLADCAAQRRIIDTFPRSGFPDEDRYSTGWHDAHYLTLLALAQPDNEHPDFQQGWALQGWPL